MSDPLDSPLYGTLQELATHLSDACNRPLTPCPMRGRLRENIYLEHSLVLPKRCPFPLYPSFCLGVTKDMWFSLLISLEAARRTKPQ